MRIAILATMTGLAALTAACTPEDGGDSVASASTTPAPVAAAAPAPAPVPSPAPTPTQAATLAPAAATASVDMKQGRQLFNDWSCGGCHVLADASAAGSIGPALDANARLTKDYVTNIIVNGQGAMPAFGGQITDDEIAVLASYVIAAKK